MWYLLLYYFNNIFGPTVILLQQVQVFSGGLTNIWAQLLYFSPFHTLLLLASTSSLYFFTLSLSRFLCSLTNSNDLYHHHQRGTLLFRLIIFYDLRFLRSRFRSLRNPSDVFIFADLIVVLSVAINSISRSYGFSDKLSVSMF